MVTTSLRDDDEVLAIASQLWEEEDARFDDKSDFYRFARDFALNEIFNDYVPEYEGFNQKISELEEVDGAEYAVADATNSYFEAFDYAVSMKNILEADQKESEKIEGALERTYEFIMGEFPQSYVAKDLE